MIYEKPIMTLKKFHTDAFLADSGVLSGDGDPTLEWSDDWGNMGWDTSGFNGTVSLDPDGVGGWFNG